MNSISFRKMRNWKFVVSAVLPWLLLPIIWVGQNETDSKRLKCGYTILLMGIFWMLEILPLSVTALFPVVLFPFLGIQSTSQVVVNYMKETQMMFIGGISIALALQYCGLHKRIALSIMILIGSSPWRLLLGILTTTCLLSCVVVVNTAVAAMMSPIVIGLIESLDSSVSESRKAKLRVVFMLAVGYGANIGGTATLIGSQPNLIYKELMEQENIGQDGKYLDLNFFTFFAYSMPIALINLILTWLILGTMHLGFQNHNSDLDSNFNALSLDVIPKNQTVDEIDLALRSSEEEVLEDTGVDIPSSDEAQMGQILKRKYAELGRMGFHQWAVLALLLLAVVLWLTRDPQIFRGWFNLFSENQPKIGDSSVGIAVLILMFIIPQKIKFFKNDFDGESESLLTWAYIQQHFPWNVIFIVGGGLAISDGANASGLSYWLGQELLGLESIPRALILFVLLVAISVFTEIMSNAAVISLLTPILISLSKRLELHPLYLTLPGAIACQYAFVLPTSNPPNAIVFSAGEMRISDMAKTGVVLNVFCVAVLYVMNLTWGEYVIFSYSNYTYENSTSVPTLISIH